MKEIKNVLICGIGAVGCIYADKIQRFCPDNLKILVDESRLKRYSANPVIYNGKEMSFEYILPEDLSFKADLIIIATKYSGLNDAIKNIKNFVKSDTIILSLLNGITSEKIIASEYGKEKLLYSYFIGHSAIREGRCVRQDGINTIVFGSDNKNDLQKTENVKNFFDKAGIHYEIPQDIIYSMWLKFMLNVSSNQTSAILKYTFGQMFNNEKCMEFLINIMKEVQLLAKAEGVNNSENLLTDALAVFKKMSPDGKTSMLQDVESGRKTEVELFAGVVTELGKKHNIPTPYNNVIKNLLEIINQQNIN